MKSHLVWRKQKDIYFKRQELFSMLLLSMFFFKYLNFRTKMKFTTKIKSKQIKKFSLQQLQLFSHTSWILEQNQQQISEVKITQWIQQKFQQFFLVKYWHRLIDFFK